MIVLDASAVIALIREESGASAVEVAVLSDQATMSAVNLFGDIAEVSRLGIDRDFIEEAINDFEIVIASMNQPLARLAADFYRHGSGLSFADRACFATAKVFAATAYTADKKWLDYGSEFGVEVVDIRQQG